MKKYAFLILILISSVKLSAKLLEKTDTIISKNSQLELQFLFDHFECGMNVLEHPNNALTSNLDFDIALSTYTYTYTPKMDFVGIDTVKFLSGCGPNPDEMVTSITEYYIKVTAHDQVLYYIDEAKCSQPWMPYPSSDIFDKKSHLNDYLTTNEISADSIEYSTVYGLLQDCRSCDCLSGNRIYVRAADYYKAKLEQLSINPYELLNQHDGYTRMHYYETQCSDQWATDATIALPSIDQLSNYLKDQGIDFKTLERTQSVDIKVVDFCEACSCGNGFRFDIVVENQYVDELSTMGFEENCDIEAGFTYDILESYPIQIQLTSTANNADNIIWTCRTQTGKDTIIGIGHETLIENINDLEIMVPNCLDCPPSITIKQVVSNMWCIDSTDNTVIIETSTSNPTVSKNTITIHPNPTKGFIQISDYKGHYPLNYELYNLSGQKLMEGITNTSSIHLNAQQGLYLLKVKSKNEFIHQDLITIE